MIVSKILSCLPAEVTYEGIQFLFRLLINHSDEIRLCYCINTVDADSPHKKDIDEHNAWNNPLHKDEGTHFCGFLWLSENIRDDEDLILAIDRTRFFLIQNGFAVPGMLLEDLTYGEAVTFDSTRLGTVQLSSVGLGETALEYYGRLMHDWAGMVIGDAAYSDQGSKQHYQYKAGQMVWLSKQFFNKVGVID